MFDDLGALLVDLDGVLYVEEEEAIVGAVEAVERLRRGALELRFVTNTTAHSRAIERSRSWLASASGSRTANW